MSYECLTYKNSSFKIIIIKICIAFIKEKLISKYILNKKITSTENYYLLLLKTNFQLTLKMKPNLYLLKSSYYL